mgnify:CR=1 FL=1
MADATPATALELRSLIKKTGELELSLAKVSVPEPGPDQVLVKVEATPINPSDLGLLLGPALPRPGTTFAVGLTALALTWLNPHVYLDTVVLLGSVAASHGDARLDGRAGGCRLFDRSRIADVDGYDSHASLCDVVQCALAPSRDRHVAAAPQQFLSNGGTDAG